MLLQYLAGPLVGAVIGYCTNYIAVKMLFRPKKEMYLFGHRLPFTPGAIPKGKPRLAKAVGNVVANTLFTDEDIVSKLTSEESEKAVVSKVMGVLDQTLSDDLLSIAGEEEKKDQMEANMTAVLTDSIYDAVNRMDVGSIIAQEGKKVALQKISGTMLMMFVSPDTIASIIDPMGEEVNRYFEENGRAKIMPEVYAKLVELEEKSILDIADTAGVERERIEAKIGSLYRDTVKNYAHSAIAQLNIAGVVEEKINEMSVESLETMVLQVMKQELDMIVNLGALIGCLIGVINIFI
ncbi:MAG: DUF445 family protein [Dorea sp.]|nr:DUF445 family protein [Dorea sp.]